MATTERLAIWTTFWAKIAWPAVVLLLIFLLSKPLVAVVTAIPDLITRSQKVVVGGLTLDTAQAKAATFVMDPDVRKAIAQLTPTDFSIFMNTAGKNFVIPQNLVQSNVVSCRHIADLGLANFSVVSNNQMVAKLRKLGYSNVKIGEYFLQPTDLGNRAAQELVAGLSAAMSTPNH